MRVISGFLRGRNILGYHIEGTRPTMDRVKESIFGSIQNYVKDSVVLDLFAGSGNLGIEAISNGAQYGYFVDNNKKAYQVIQSNIQNFHIQDKCHVMLCDYKKALQYFSDHSICFDIIFVDPPYRYEIMEEIIEFLKDKPILKQGGILVLEFRSDRLLNSYFGYRFLKKKKYGDKFVYILLKNN